MPLPTFTDIASSAEFKALPHDKRMKLTNAYWNDYEKENPGDREYAAKQRELSSQFLSLKDEASRADPFTKRKLDAALDDTKFALIASEGVKTGQIDREQYNISLENHKQVMSDHQRKIDEISGFIEVAKKREGARQGLSQVLQQANLFGSATTAMSGAPDKDIRRGPDGNWDLPLMMQTGGGAVLDTIGGTTVALGQKTGARLDSAGPAVDKQKIQNVFHEFQQKNNLSDEEVATAWKDLGNMYRKMEPTEKGRVLSDGTILPNYANSEWLDTAKAASIIDSMPAPDLAKEVAKSKLPAIQREIAGSKLEAYAAAASGTPMQDPVEWARVNGRLKDFGTPGFVQDYEAQVASKAGWGQGLVADFHQGNMKLASTLAGVAGMAGSKTAGAAGAEVSKASGLVGQGSKDTGLVGSIIEELPSLITQIALTRGMGAATTALGASEAAALRVGTLGALVTAGAQSAGATYSDLIAGGASEQEAREKAAKAGLNTALITGLFQGIGAGGVEKVAAGKAVGEITLREVFKSASKKDLVKNLGKFTGNLAVAMGGEGLEEGADELTAAFLNADPDTNLADAWTNAIEAAKVGAVIGGTVETISKAITKPTYNQGLDELERTANLVSKTAAKENLPEIETAGGTVAAPGDAGVAKAERPKMTREELLEAVEARKQTSTSEEERQILETATPEEVAARYGVEITETTPKTVTEAPETVTEAAQPSEVVTTPAGAVETGGDQEGTGVAKAEVQGEVSPVNFELKDTTVMVRDEMGEPVGERPAKAFTATDPENDSRAIGTLDGEKLQITDIRTKRGGEKISGTRFFERVVRAGQSNGAATLEVKLQSLDTRAVLKRLVEKGVLTNPRQEFGDSMDRHPTLFDIAPTPTTNENQVQETSGLPPQQGVATQPAAEVQAETGTPQREGEGQEGQEVVPEPVQRIRTILDSEVQAPAELAEALAALLVPEAPVRVQTAPDQTKLVQGELFQNPEAEGDPAAKDYVKSFKGTPPKGATRALIDYAGDPLLARGELGDLPANTVKDIQLADTLIQQMTKAVKKNGIWVGVTKVGRIRFNEFLAKMWKRNNRGSKPGWINFQDRRSIRKLAKVLSFEVAHALTKDGSGKDWYRAKIDEMYGTLSKEFPELADPDGRGRFLFSVILAATSNGQDVLSNMEDAIRIYRMMGGSPNVPGKVSIKRSSRDGPVNQSLRAVRILIDELGWQGAKDFMLKPITVSQLKKEHGIEIKGELADHTVIGAMIMGPKIGSFWGNLNGHYDSITMDLWFTRSMNRLSGDNATINHTKMADALEILSKLQGVPSDVVKDIRDYVNAARDGEGQSWTKIASDIREESEVLYDYLKSTMAAYANTGFAEEARTPINTRVKSILQVLDGGQESPDNGTHRAWMRKVVETAQADLRKNGVNITNADFQAVLWFHEKDLYTRFGATSSRGGRMDYAQAVEMALKKSRMERGATAGGAVVSQDRPLDFLKEVPVQRRENERERQARQYRERMGLVTEEDTLFQAERGPKGQVEFKGLAEALVTLFKTADTSTAIHEMAHVARRFLFNRDIPQENRLGISDDDIAAAEKWAGVKDGIWDRAAEEKFARGFERYIRDGKFPENSAVAEIFSKMAKWLQSIYKVVAGSSIDVEITPEIRQVFDRLITRGLPQKPATKPAAKPAAKPKKELPPLPPGPSRSTSLKNAATDRYLEEHGLAPIMRPAKQENEETWNEAMMLVEKDSGYGTRLVNGVLSNKRNIGSEVEEAVMLHELAIRKAAVVRARDAVNNGNPDAKRDLEQAQKELMDVITAAKMVGTTTARMLQFRKRFITEDFSLEAMEARFQAEINDGDKLTESQMAWVKSMQKKVTDAQARVAELEKQVADQEKANLTIAHLDKVEKDVKKATRKPVDRRTLTERVVEKAQSARDRLRSRGFGVTRLEQRPEGGYVPSTLTKDQRNAVVNSIKQRVRAPRDTVNSLAQLNPADVMAITEKLDDSTLRYLTGGGDKRRLDMLSSLRKSVNGRRAAMISSTETSPMQDGVVRQPVDRVAAMVTRGVDRLEQRGEPAQAQPLTDAQYARHAELEAKHNAGTITDAERREAQRLVEEAARAAGYTTRAWHAGTVEGVTEFAPLTHFASDPRQAQAIRRRREAMRETLADAEYDVFLNTNNYKRVDDQWNWEARMREAVAEGFSGLIYKNYGEGFNTDDGAVFVDSFVPANPSQIKSADPFTGKRLRDRFNPSSPNILYQEPELTQQDLEDLSEILASYIVKGDTQDAALEKLSEEFGSIVDLNTDAIADAAQAAIARTAAGSRAKTPRELVNLLDEDNPELSNRLVYNMVRGLVEQGVPKEKVLKKAHEMLQEKMSGVTFDQVSDAFTGYGTVKFPSQEETAKAVREIRNIERIKRQIRELQAKRAPKKTGQQRDPDTSDIRKLKKELKEAFRAAGIKHTTSATQLKGALDAIKTRLKNEIEDLERAANTKIELIRKKTNIDPNTDPEIIQLRKRRDAARARYDQVFGVNRRALTDAQRLRAAVRMLNKRIKEERALAEAGLVDRIKSKTTPVTSAEVEALRGTLKGLVEARTKAKAALAGDVDEGARIMAQAKKVAERQIALYEKLLAGAVDKQGRQQIVPTEELAKLWTLRDELKDAVKSMRKAQRQSLRRSPEERARAASLRALEKSVKDLEARLARGDLSRRGKAPLLGPDTLAVSELKKRQEAARAALKALAEAKLPSKEERREAALIRASETRRKKLEARIAAGDFVEVEPVPRTVSRALAEARLAEAKVKEEWNRRFFEKKLSERTGAEIAWDTTTELVNFSRSVMTSADVSAPFRQGMVTMLMHPILSLRAIPQMFFSGFSQVRHKEFLDRLERHPMYAIATQAGLFMPDADQGATLAKMEEAFRGRWAREFAPTRGVVGFSERAYNAYLSQVRLQHFAAMVNGFASGKPTEKEAKVVADFVNKCTGRGNLADAESSAAVLAHAFFSPKFLVSRFQVLLGAVPAAYGAAFGPKDLKRVRRAILGEYARFLIGVGSVYALGVMLNKMIGGDDEDEPFIEIDPRSSKFGQMRFGKTYIDLMGGLLQAATFMSRILPTRSDGVWSFYTKTRKGELKDLRMAGYGEQSVSSVIGQFIRGKMAPVPASILTMMNGVDVIGRPTTIRAELIGTLMPLSLGDITNIMQEHGVTGAPLALAVLFGVGVRVHNEDLELEQYLSTWIGVDKQAYEKKSGSSSPRLLIENLKF